MTEKNDIKLILENGREYTGRRFGAFRESVLEIVFNTSMAGYQEIMSDPSYTDQAVVMTYPLIGNYGMAEDDYESLRPSAGAVIVREYNDEPSNFRSVCTLGSVMERFGITGISGIDTRRLNRTIRDFGSMKALVTDINTPLGEGLAKLSSAAIPKDVVSRVSCRAARREGPEDARFHVAAIDCGMKDGIVRALISRGCRLTVVPWNTSAEDILALRPDGVLISNGPGDPRDIPETIAAVGGLIGRLPVFGICLGHQILALACGASVYKLKFGHRGGNHPVRDLRSGRIEITSQNHSYAVDPLSLTGTGLSATHVNILDGTVEGISREGEMAFGVQYHPESSPGPCDSGYLFDRFAETMEKVKSDA